MTENSDPKLSEVARHIVMPSGIVTSMFPKVNKRAKACGIRYDRWQQGLLTLILGRRKDGTFAASVGGVVLSICRQTGKTFTVSSLVVILCTLIPDLTVIWTAHHNRTNSNTFDHVRTLVRNPALIGYLAPTACAAATACRKSPSPTAARYCSAHEPRASPEATTP